MLYSLILLDMKYFKIIYLLSNGLELIFEYYIVFNCYKISFLLYCFYVLIWV